MSDKPERDDAESVTTAATSVAPRSPRDVAEAVARALRGVVIDTEPAEQRPLTAEEFAQALQSLYETGCWFDESGALIRLATSSSPYEDEVLDDLSTRYPYLPAEVAELSWWILTGKPPRASLVGSTGVAREKRAVVEARVLTDEIRESFFLRHCGKIPRFVSLDWEVVVKHAERGHQQPLQFPYALATLDTINDVHAHHKHETVTFALGQHGLRRLIRELSDLLEQLERVSQAVGRPINDTLEDNDE